jgi:hypothetical protein
MLLDKKTSLCSRLGFNGLEELGSRITRRLIAVGFPVAACGLDHTKAPRVRPTRAASGATRMGALPLAKAVIVAPHSSDACNMRSGVN